MDCAQRVFALTLQRMTLPAHTEIILEVPGNAFDELQQKLVTNGLTDRVFDHEGATYLDYNELPIKKQTDGGDVSAGTWNQTLAAFVTQGLYDRWYWDPEETETEPGARVVDMSATAVKQQA